MDENNNFAAFYENSYSADLTEAFSSVASRAAGDIHGITSFIKSLTGKSPEEQERIIERCADSLKSVSNRLYRASYFCDTITRHKVKLSQLSAGSYAEQFIEKCSTVLNDQVKFGLNIRNDFQFVSDGSIIDLLLLGFIRRSCSASVNNNTAIRAVVNVEITAEIIGTSPELSLFTETVPPEKNNGDMGDIEFFNNYFNEIISVISDKIHSDIETVITANSNQITLRFDPDKRIDPDVRQKIYGVIHDNENIFNIMLNDLV